MKSIIKRQGRPCQQIDDFLKISFARDLKKFDVKRLTPADERALLTAVSEGDEEAFDRVVVCNLPLVWVIAAEFEWSEVPFLDLVQEGALGLMKSIRRFRFGKGAKLSTYVSLGIKQAILQAIGKQSGFMRVPVHVIQTIGKLRRTIHKLETKLGCLPTDEDIAKSARISLKRVRRFLAFSKRSSFSLNDSFGHDNGGLGNSEIIPDTNVVDPSSGSGLDGPEIAKQVSRLLTTLNPVEREILMFRFGFYDGRIWTLEKLGARFGVTRERIRQIQSTAISKLRHPNRIKMLTGFC